MQHADCHNGISFTLIEPSSQHKDDTLKSLQIPVICLHGSGDATHSAAWEAAVHGIAESSTVLYYERRGIGRSSEAGLSDSVQSRRQQQTPRQAVEDLTDLLQSLHLKGPYILLAHSYGGTIAREFLHRHPGRVAGMVLAETGQETPTKYDQEQYDKQALGSRPLSVIHANSLYSLRANTATNAASQAGLEMQAKWAAEDERLKKAQLQLSSKARYVRIDDCGHHVVRDRPDAVVSEVNWVLENVEVGDLKALVHEPFWTWLRRYLGRITSRSRSP